jgi:hypothetical protein
MTWVKLGEATRGGERPLLRRWRRLRMVFKIIHGVAFLSSFDTSRYLTFCYNLLFPLSSIPSIPNSLVLYRLFIPVLKPNEHRSGIFLSLT